MHLSRSLNSAVGPPPAVPHPPVADTDPDQVQAGLCLVLPLKNPAQMPALLRMIASRKPAIDATLKGLGSVHFARFVPTPDGAALLVLTEYDGEMKPYVMDFASELADDFTSILSYVRDAPRLPVNQYPTDFWKYIESHNIPVPVWCAYPNQTVLDIVQPSDVARSTPARHKPATPLDLSDIQGNLLRGYRAAQARHFLLEVRDPGAACRFLEALTPGANSGFPEVTTAAERSARPPYSLNVGLTAAGLTALGMPPELLAAFPEAFTGGPTRHEMQGPVGAFQRDIDIAKTLGDVGESDPSNWVFGGPKNEAIHVIVSLYAGDGVKAGVSERKHSLSSQFEAASASLRAAFPRYGLNEFDARDALALPNGQIHFGYRDGIAQPRIDGVGQPRMPGEDKVTVPTGDFLLGRDYVNSRKGNFLGDLPPGLGDNATYGVLRMMKQDVEAFEAFIRGHPEAGSEQVAAKLMGRWRNGVPLDLSPDTDQGFDRAHINSFDFAKDSGGSRCPVGAHIRRLNPRQSVVMGSANSRRIVRRGMPYGDAYHPDAGEKNGTVERGLIGYFLCGDLEFQFEFILSNWANAGFSRPGIRGTVDPILGNRPTAGQFLISNPRPNEPPVTLDGLHQLVTTRGTAYAFFPGVGGLRYLARRAWVPTTSRAR